MSNNRKSKKLPAQELNKRKLERHLAKEKRKADISRKKAAYYKKDAAERERNLKRLMKAVQGKGIYDPRETTLTKYRKSRLRKIAVVFEELFDPKNYAFLPTPKKDRKKILGRAASLEMKTTRTGIFVPKEKHKNVKLGRDKKRGEYYIRKSGRTKWGENQGRKYTTITPLASVDELEKEIDRLKRMADKLGPLRKGERITFEITERGNEGFSHNTFSNIDLLLNQLENYRKSTAARLQFFRHIKIVKTETAGDWFREHPVKAPKKFGRSIYTKRSRMSPSGRKI